MVITMPKITASRYHDISCGHRVVGHEGKCRHLHGHNYRVHFNCQSTELDSVGRVVDFSVIKEKLCMWLEENWDHKFLAWEKDEFLSELFEVDKQLQHQVLFEESLVWLPFNPTAENMAKYLVDVVAPEQLRNTNVTLTKVVIEETCKCSVEYSL
jgi:6-pyruvoyltetrahydropterin/6-carboxytetrahydropterin synthase